MTAAPNLQSSPRLPVDEAVIRAEGLQLQPRGGQGRGTEPGAASLSSSS